MIKEIKVFGVELEVEVENGDLLSVCTCSTDMIDNLLSEDAIKEILRKLNED